MADTRPCKYCENPVARNAKRCPKCGGKSPFPVKPGEVLGGLLVLSALIYTCCIWYPNRERPAASPATTSPTSTHQDRPAQPPPNESGRSGSIVIIECPGENQAFVAVDYAAHDALISASGQGNGAMVSQLVASGRVYLVSNGTRATVTKSHILTVEVEIMEGSYAGKRGVVVNEWLKPAR